jgi:hypothetical protein
MVVIDAVLSYHMNPQTCGVAKFNHELAKRLGVPMLKLGGADVGRPLVSIKFSEIRPYMPMVYSTFDLFGTAYAAFDLFLHDLPCLGAEWRTVLLAARVYAGNRAIADQLRARRPDVIEAFCPSTIIGNPERGAYRVLVFGMAHKLALPHFERLKARLDAEHPDYTIELSTAVHEGSPWDQALTDSVTAMRGIFGDKLRVLGYLGDDALAKELRDCDAVAAFYVPALRANNTTAWAALAAGKPLYTNTDEYSPSLDPEIHSWEMLCALMKGAA